MMAEISAFAQSTVGKHVEGDLQSIIARLRVLGKNVLREEDEISDVAKAQILGGNLAGLTTVLVDPLVRYDLPHTLVLRRLTGRVMAGRRPLA